MYGRRLTAQQKDERQDNGDKNWLARHHPSDLLHSLSRERIGGGQHVANASSFAISNFSCAPREAPDAYTYLVYSPFVYASVFPLIIGPINHIS